MSVSRSGSLLSKLYFNSHRTIFSSSRCLADKNTENVAKSVKEAEETAKVYSKHVDSAVETWAKCNDVYYGKERDLQNFPTLRVPDQHPPVRMGVIPDNWFQAFYDKTGVTGPYMFGIGMLTYLLSKEILVYDAHLMEFLPFIVCTTALIKRFGPQIAKQADEAIEKLEHLRFEQPIKEVKDHLDQTINTASDEINRANVVPILAKAKQENLAFQMESAYRARLAHVYKTVQRRLDYHVARENTRKEFQQQHMVKWIVDAVKKGITPQQEKETIVNCIAELKRLGQTAKTS